MLMQGVNVLPVFLLRSYLKSHNIICKYLNIETIRYYI